MPTFGTLVNPAHYVEVPDSLNPGQVKRPEAGVVLKVKDLAGNPQADVVTLTYGYWLTTVDSDVIYVSGDGGATWAGPLLSAEVMLRIVTGGDNSALALQQSADALSAAQQALQAAQGGTGGSIAGAPATWPTTFPPSLHTHPASQISDSTAKGRELLTAADAQAARAAILAAPSSTVSFPGFGSTATTAAPGNHAHAASAIAFTPTGSNSATNVQDAIVQAGATGGGGGASAIYVVKYASGAYPTQPANAPAGVQVRHFYGPVEYAGPTWAGVVDINFYVALT